VKKKQEDQRPRALLLWRSKRNVTGGNSCRRRDRTVIAIWTKNQYLALPEDGKGRSQTLVDRRHKVDGGWNAGLEVGVFGNRREAGAQKAASPTTIQVTDEPIRALGISKKAVETVIINTTSKKGPSGKLEVANSKFRLFGFQGKSRSNDRQFVRSAQDRDHRRAKGEEGGTPQPPRINQLMIADRSYRAETVFFQTKRPG